MLLDSRVRSGTVTLPLTTTIPGRTLTLKDSTGASGVSSITISTSGGETFEDGNTTKTLNTAYGFLNLTGNGGKWYIAAANQPTTATVSSLTASTINGAAISFPSGNAVTFGGAITTPNVAANTIGGTIMNSSNLYAILNFNNVPATPITAVTTTFAGNRGIASTDGTGTSASFHYLVGVVYNPSTGGFYVLERDTCYIRAVTAAGVVTTLAGGYAATPVDGTGTNAKISGMSKGVCDSAGNLYFTDGNRIRRCTPSGVITTVAGSATGSSVNGTGTNATFNNPQGLAIDSTGTNMYICDSTGNYIRKMVISSAVVTTFVGTGSGAIVDGTGTNAQVQGPKALAYDTTTNTLVLVDSGPFGNYVRRITMAGVVTTLVGKSGPFMANDGVGTNAGFYGLTGVAVDQNSGLIYTAEYNNNLIRRITPGNVVTTISGGGNGSGGGATTQDGIGNVASFQQLCDIACDSNGTVFAVDMGQPRLAKVLPTVGLAGNIFYNNSHITTTLSSSVLNVSSINGQLPWSASNAISTTAGLGTAGYISSGQLVSSITAATFTGSTNYVSAAVANISSMTALSMTATSTTVGRTQAFTPKSILGLQMWLDASDPTTFTYSSGSTISLWLDKSGQGYHASNSGSVYTSTNSVVFSGNTLQTYLTSSGMALNVFQEYGFIVFTTANTTQMSLIGGSYYQSRGIIVQNGSTGTGGSSSIHNVNNGGDYIATITNASWANNAPQMVDWSSGGYLGFNASTIVNSGSNYTNYMGPWGQRFSIIGGGNPGYTALTGTINEVVIYQGVTLSSNDIYAVEGYLAAKWNFKANLPATHLYKTVDIRTSTVTTFDAFITGTDTNNVAILPNQFQSRASNIYPYTTPKTQLLGHVDSRQTIQYLTLMNTGCQYYLTTATFGTLFKFPSTWAAGGYSIYFPVYYSSNDAGGYWDFHNQTNSNITVTVTNGGALGNFPMAPYAMARVTWTGYSNVVTQTTQWPTILTQDLTNNRLGLNNTPSYTFDVTGTSRFTSNVGIGTVPLATSNLLDVGGVARAQVLSTLALNVSSINGDQPWLLSNAISTAAGLTSNISSMIDPTELTSSIVGLGTSGFVSTLGLTYTVASTAAGLGTLGYTSTSQLLSTTVGTFTQINNSIATTVQPQFASTVAGLGTAGYISTTALTSSLLGTKFSGSTNFVSAAIAQISSLSTVNIQAATGYISSLTVDNLALGSNAAFFTLGDVLATSLSTFQVNTGVMYMNSTFIGNASSQTAVQFYGNSGAYNQTVLAEQSTGSGIQEFLIFRGSSASDRIRMQTTGAIVFEPGVTQRLWPNAPSNATPAMIINSSSNIGILTASPAFPLDVAGIVRAPTVSTLQFTASSIQSGYTSTIYLQTVTAVASNVGIQTNASPTIPLDVAGIARAQTLSTFTINVSSINGVTPWQPIFLQSTVQGLGTATFVSSLSLTSTVANLGQTYVSTASLVSSIASLRTSISTTYISAATVQATQLSTLNLQVSSINGALPGTGSGGTTFVGSTVFVSAATVQASTLSSLTLQANSGYVSSLTVDSLQIGSNSAYISLGDAIATSISTIVVRAGTINALTINANSTLTSTLFTNSTLLGTSSLQTAIQFYGLTGNYTNTVLAEQSTSATSQEFILFRGSSVTDRIRMQTTGNIVFEPGVTSRMWPNTPSNVTPAMIINSASNIGILTAAPAFPLDVAGTGRFQILSTMNLQVCTINGAAPGTGSGGTTFIGSTIFLSSAQGFVSSLTVNALTIGTTAGFTVMGDVIAASLSTINLNVSTINGAVPGSGSGSSSAFNGSTITVSTLQLFDPALTFSSMGNLYVRSSLLLYNSTIVAGARQAQPQMFTF